MKLMGVIALNEVFSKRYDKKTGVWLHHMEHGNEEIFVDLKLINIIEIPS